MIPILMAVFALGGTTFGMAEESLAFYALIITVMIAAGYDALVGALDRPARLRDRRAGLDDQPVRHRASPRASPASSISEGLDRPARHPDRRHGASASAFVLRYADRVKADPTKSLVYDMKADNEAHFSVGDRGAAAVVAHRPQQGRARAVLRWRSP